MGKVIVIAGEMQVGKDTFAEVLVNAGFKQGSFAANLKEMCRNIFNLSDYLMNTQEGKRKNLNPPIDFDRKKLALIVEWVKKTHNIGMAAVALKEIEKEHIIDFVTEHGKYKSFSTPREVLQFVGTEVCRRLSENYHAQVLLTQMKEASDADWVITDARFPNERAIIRDNFPDAYLIRLKRPGFTPDHLLNAQDPKGQLKVVNVHASENSLGSDEEYDEVIINSGTVEELHDKARMFT